MNNKLKGVITDEEEQRLRARNEERAKALIAKLGERYACSKSNQPKREPSQPVLNVGALYRAAINQSA